MIPALLLLAAQVAGPPAPPPTESCAALAARDPARARGNAERWRLAGGGPMARQCMGLAWAKDARWLDAAASFEQAAREAEVARDPAAATYWAQAGNAWLAAADATKARAALDAALAAGTLTGLDLGEAQLDRARTLVALQQPAAARLDLDSALRNAPDDPLAWLLSATLARRMGDLPRARTDLAEALKRSPDDAAVQLEAGNLAALTGDEAAARRAWGEAARLAPTLPAGRSATAALAQFGSTGTR
ncbi:tetratricopeptide repeat protein [Sphingomonas mollis]|uniref:Tetratricopeptide repeat protein n=1 Tax=Sphingomonas mollis TaxID=2795726 RepID=A0ABS0XJM3_9SPHN|nr:tetratricopeptide repeat protein [Sphingomonas sp. BT553]MBJ6120236.1 hypothetical protein [Sphingomonas sp. BT553]